MTGNSVMRGKPGSPTNWDLDGDVLNGMPAYFEITAIGHMQLPVAGGSHAVWDIRGDAPSDCVRVGQPWYDKYLPIMGGYIVWKTAAGGIRVPVYTPTLPYVEPLKPLDFSRLNKLMSYSQGEGALSLLQTFSVFTKRHGAQYCAALIANEDLVGETLETFAEDWGYEHLMQQRPWYPYRTGATAEEAMRNLLTFLNEELTHDRDELITWAGNCGALEYYLSKGDDGGYHGGKGQLPDDWVLTYEEAIGRKPEVS